MEIPKLKLQRSLFPHYLGRFPVTEKEINRADFI